MIVQGVRLLDHDPYLGGLTRRTLQLAFESTLIAALIGLPLACAIGLGRRSGSRRGLIAANAGLGLPPVAVGVYGYLVLQGHSAPGGGLWLNSMRGMVLAQTILALPIVVALAAIAIRTLPPVLVDQARAFGAGRGRLAVFCLREAKAGVLTALILALGSAFAEVGAVTIIGGNSTNTTATLASQVINDAHADDIPRAVEHTIVLLALMLALGVALTLVQHGTPGAARRGMRRAVALGAVVVASVVLAACGTTVHPADNRATAYAIDANGTSPPLGDLARLLTQRARATGMTPVLTAAAGPTLQADVRRQTRRGIYDPASNRTPPVNSLVVVGALAPGALDPIAAAAMRRGVKIVSYPLALPHRTAAVVADPARGARLLGDDAAAWAHAHGRDHGHALLVLPPPEFDAVNPYAARAATIERALRAALAAHAPGVRVTTATGAYPAGGARAVTRALQTDPRLSIVLAWDDDTALGAAQALKATDGPRFAGALGAPAVTSRATLDALGRDGPLNAVVAVDPRDLADALVDLPRALLRGARPRDVELPWRTLTARSPTLAAYARSYARHAATTAYADTQLNPAALEQNR